MCQWRHLQSNDKCSRINKEPRRALKLHLGLVQDLIPDTALCCSQSLACNLISQPLSESLSGKGAQLSGGSAGMMNFRLELHLLQCNSQCWSGWAGDWAAPVPVGGLVRRAAAFGGSRSSKARGKAVAAHHSWFSILCASQYSGKGLCPRVIPGTRRLLISWFGMLGFGEELGWLPKPGTQSA